jgi:hypothetical protein
VFSAAGVDGVAALLDRFRKKLGSIVVLAAALPLVATSTMLWGFGGRVQNSQFPNDWYRAEATTADEDGSLMVLPWNHYQPLPFAGFRIIGNPAHHFFSRPAVISDHAQLFVRGETPPADPRDIYVDQLLRSRRRISNLGHLIAPLGVHYVVLPYVADWRSYERFLERQSDVRPLFTGDELTLNEKTAYAGNL